jgi:hypothetical protein
MRGPYLPVHYFATAETRRLLDVTVLHFLHFLSDSAIVQLRIMDPRADNETVVQAAVLQLRGVDCRVVDCHIFQLELS